MYKTLAITKHWVYSKSMSVQYTLLGFLAEESNYGYELKKKYDGYFGKDKPILTGQIYSTLARLKRDNKVKEIADTSESGGPDRVRYEITDEGKQDLQAWLESPEAPSPQLQATMYIKAVLAILKDGDRRSSSRCRVLCCTGCPAAHCLSHRPRPCAPSALRRC